MGYDEDEEESSNVHEDSGADDLISSELMPDYRDVFQTMEWFDSRESLINWVRERAIPLGIVVIVRSSEIGSEGRMPRLELCCERSGYPRKSKPKLPKQTCNLEQENMEKVLEKKHESSTKLRKSGSKRIGCPFHLKGHYLGDVGKWSLEVICGIHNHAQARYLEGHAYVGRLTSDEEKLVASLSSTHSRPKEILVALKKIFTNNKSTIKTIYNIRHRQRYEDHAGRSQMQYLLGKLEEYGYYQHIKRCHQTDTVTHMFYAHPKSVQLLRAFPNVLLMDCTYKTNRYRLPLFEIVGVTSTNMTFSVACAYLNSEKEESYTWALTVLKSLMNQWSLPRVIVTDREIVLMNAIERTFPSSHHILCLFHINKNLAANCKKGLSKNEWNAFLTSWTMMVRADTEEEYAEYLRRFHEDNAAHTTCVKYAMNNWIAPYKERFVSCWTNKMMHYDNTTTNRAEGAHAKLKRFLGSNTGNLETCWEKIHTLFATLAEQFPWVSEECGGPSQWPNSRALRPSREFGYPLLLSEGFECFDHYLFQPNPLNHSLPVPSDVTQFGRKARQITVSKSSSNQYVQFDDKGCRYLSLGSNLLDKLVGPDPLYFDDDLDSTNSSRDLDRPLVRWLPRIGLFDLAT